MSKGIDYGMGQTNIDHSTGIRYGVIPSHEVCQAWADSSEADYGQACCPDCGNEVEAYDADTMPDSVDDYVGNGCWDYVCHNCQKALDSSEVFGEEPLGWYVDDGEYKAKADIDGDIFVLSSPYYTKAAYCSPCAPGACYLTSSRDDGDKAYCFGHKWFDEGIAPYPVFRVSDDVQLVATRQNVQCPNCQGSGKDSLKRVMDARGKQMPTSLSQLEPDLLARLTSLNIDSTWHFDCWRCHNGSGHISEVVITEQNT